ncbi:S26 family signal peptidase [Bradyrhizobium sp. 156]|nr:S26 family signal peptidase [Bradyrhizobium sp. 156]
MHTSRSAPPSRSLTCCCPDPASAPSTVRDDRFRLGRVIVVPPGHLSLHSPFAGSYDSRYFGPVPSAGLLGLARPLLTLSWLRPQGLAGRA